MFIQANSEKVAQQNGKILKIFWGRGGSGIGVMGAIV
jgi:hypothetical protein